MSGRISYVLAIEATNVSEGHKVIVYNRNTQEKLTGIFDSSGQCVLDLVNFTNEVSVDNVLEVKVISKYIAQTTHTISLSGITAGGANISLTTLASPSSLVAVSL